MKSRVFATTALNRRDPIVLWNSLVFRRYSINCREKSANFPYFQLLVTETLVAGPALPPLFLPWYLMDQLPLLLFLDIYLQFNVRAAQSLHFDYNWSLRIQLESIWAEELPSFPAQLVHRDTDWLYAVWYEANKTPHQFPNFRFHQFFSHLKRSSCIHKFSVKVVFEVKQSLQRRLRILSNKYNLSTSTAYFPTT
jgi:hypothetical protein